MNIESLLTDHDPTSHDRTSGRAGPGRAPLVVTADVTLRDELLRLAAAAGVAPEVAPDPGTALRSWTRAPVVLVGADLAAGLADLSPGRRDGVHVLSWGSTPDELFRVAVALGAENVAELPRSEGWVVEILTDLGEAGRSHGTVVGVVGGAGGAGATTLACALGQTAATHGETVVVDCDPFGPGLDRVLGLDQTDGFRWDALCQTTGRLSARALREALPHRDGLGVLTWYAGAVATLQPFAVRETLSAARRGHETVLLDLPRSPDPLLDEVVSRCDVLLVVTPATVAGLASAARVTARHRGRVPLGLVQRGHDLSERDLTGATDVPVLGVLPHQRGLAEAIDLGLGPVRSHRAPLARACTDLLAVLRPAGAGAGAGLAGAVA